MVTTPLFKRMMKAEKKDVLHTSVYGRAQEDDTIGVVSTQSFADRMKVESNRKYVKAYGDSRLMMNLRKASGVRARTYVAPEGGSTSKNRILRVLEKERAKLEAEYSGNRKSTGRDGPRDPRASALSDQKSDNSVRRDGPRDPRHPGVNGTAKNQGLAPSAQRANTNMARAQRAAMPLRRPGL